MIHTGAKANFEQREGRISRYAGLGVRRSLAQAHGAGHDFLAASYWVETGGFASVKKHDWTARTAYAACLTQDSTEIFKAALQAPDALHVVAEMLSNGAPMNLKVVARLLRTYFSQSGRLNVLSEPGSNIFTANLSSDFIRGAVTRVLDRLVEEYAQERDVVGDALIAYCLLELRSRGVKLDHVTYAALKTGFQREDLVLQVPGLGNVQLQEMDPAAGKVPSIAASARKTIGGGPRKP